MSGSNPRYISDFHGSRSDFRHSESQIEPLTRADHCIERPDFLDKDETKDKICKETGIKVLMSNKNVAVNSEYC